MMPYPNPTVGAGYGPMPRPSVARWSRGYVGGLRLARWRWRLLSGLIDYGPLMVIAWMFSFADAALLLAQFITTGVLIANNIILQGMTGQSLGKRLLGLQLVIGVRVPGAGNVLVYPGIRRCLFRQLFHFVDILPWPPLCIGFVRPVWQRLYRTWADSMTSTVVLFREYVPLEQKPRGAQIMPQLE